MLARRSRGSTRRVFAAQERGAVAVEFALVLPVLVMLMFGIFSAGQVYSDHLSVTNAVRESARFGAAIDSTDGSTWASSVRQRVEQVYMNGMGSLSSSQICVKLVDSDDDLVPGASALGGSCGAEPAIPDGVSSGNCVVKVWVQKPATISLMMIPALDLNIGAQSVSFYGRETAACSVA